jgi:hypothetical protein
MDLGQRATSVKFPCTAEGIRILASPLASRVPGYEVVVVLVEISVTDQSRHLSPSRSAP